MGFPFLKVSAAALTALTLAFATLGATSISLAQDATLVATAAVPALTNAPTVVAPAATVVATAAATAAVVYPACPSTATAAATIAATAAATVAATAGTAAPTSTLPPTATPNPGAGYLGIAAQQVQSCGAQLLDVRPGTGAEAAKLQVGDIVVAVDGTAITSLDQFRMIVQGHKPGDKITITYQRGGSQASVLVTLGVIPPDTVATAASTAAATTAK